MCNICRLQGQRQLYFFTLPLLSLSPTEIDCLFVASSNGEAAFRTVLATSWNACWGGGGRETGGWGGRQKAELLAPSALLTLGPERGASEWKRGREQAKETNQAANQHVHCEAWVCLPRPLGLSECKLTEIKLLKVNINVICSAYQRVIALEGSGLLFQRVATWC